MDLYARLGVGHDATKDEIRDAYRERLDALAAADAAEKVTDDVRAANRAQRARLNEAWNVLSDPAQRERYDAGATLGDADSEVPELVFEAPPSAGGAGERVVGGGPLSQRSRRTVITLPDGMVLADTRPRLLGMVFDLTVVIFLVFACQLAGQRIIKEQYPVQTARVDAAREARTAASEELTAATDARKAAQAEFASARGSADRAAAEADLDAAKADERSAEQADTKAAKRLSDAQAELQGPGTVVLVASAFLGLLYLVPSTALTGRTFGMRLRQTKVVRIDGSPVSWGGAIIRFGVPIAIVTALFFSLPGLLLGLGAVMFWLWDPNRQGLHDRLARTLLVAAPVSKRS